ncbi:MAG: hypothetical protein IT260_03900 [Saprospiraceae bacterium]|nr:hypothetical protein [Saprospiraceae bacterium]
MKTRLLRVLPALLCLFVQTLLSGQAPPLASVFDYLTRDESARIQLDMNLDSLLLLRKTGTYIPVKVTGPDGRPLDAEIRPRGRYRRMKCDIPPIKIKFSKAALAAAQLDTLNEIKVVFPCSDSTENLDLVLREYFAYRMFEHLSPRYCFRARLIQLSIMDPKRPAPLNIPALLVEHDEEVTARLKGRVLEEWGIKTERVQADQAALLAVYQYLIGNTDWDITSMRNVLLVQAEGVEKVLTIPYDFDFAGLVNAPYASPSSESKLRSVRDRFLMDMGLDRKLMRQATEAVIAARADLMRLCSSPQLSAQAQAEVVQFMDRFFDAAGQYRNLPEVLKLSDK